MKKLYLLSLFSILLVAGCGSSVRVFHDSDPDAAFDQYKTYSFMDWTDGNLRTVSNIERERIRIAMAQEIESMGMTFSDNNPDIKIQLTIYFRRAGHNYYHYYGYPGGINTYMERALTVDIFEGNTKKHVWHSAAIGKVRESPQERAEELPEIVSRLFEDYPGKKEI